MSGAKADAFFWRDVMKCSNCWSRRIDSADKSLVYKVLAAVFMMKPVKCRHCFYSFHIPLWKNTASEKEFSDSSRSVGEQQDAEIFPFTKSKKQVDSKSESIGLRKAA